MKITLAAEDRGTTGRETELTLQCMGSEAYVVIEVDGREYWVDYRDFCRSAQAIGLFSNGT